MIFSPIMCMHISCVGLCVHVFMNPMPVDLYAFFLRRFNILCYASGFYMLLFFCQMFMMHVCVCVCVCVCVVIYWHCLGQLSMFNMEKRYRNKIIIIIIKQAHKVMSNYVWAIGTRFACLFRKETGFMQYLSHNVCVKVCLCAFACVCVCVHMRACMCACVWIRCPAFCRSTNQCTK